MGDGKEGDNLVLLLVQVCSGRFHTQPIHLYQFSEMYTYSHISHINVLPINIYFDDFN